jgi:hypothetical protein
MAVVAGGLLLQVPTSCAEFTATIGVTSLDFCSLLNCEGSAYFDFCDPILIFIDCQ